MIKYYVTCHWMVNGLRNVLEFDVEALNSALAQDEIFARILSTIPYSANYSDKFCVVIEEVDDEF